MRVYAELYQRITDNVMHYSLLCDYDKEDKHAQRMFTYWLYHRDKLYTMITERLGYHINMDY